MDIILCYTFLMDNQMTHRKLYEIFKARDARFDGRFFVGVTSTGIYCRPVCRARMPKEENCRFFKTAAEAEAAGFRPCMTCRPEMAPGHAPVDARLRLAGLAAQLIEAGCGSGEGISAVADRLGCSDRHLRRVFTEEFNVTPVQYQQTARLLLAKNLLTDTDLSVLDVAMASGFGSLRQFNHAFREHYHMPPTALRRKLNKNRASGEISVASGYRVPYRYDELLRFFEMRAIPGVENVADGVYRRTVCLPGNDGRPLRGWISISNEPSSSALRVKISDTLLPVLPQVLGRVRQMFDLYCDPGIVSLTLDAMNTQKPGVYIPGVRVPGCFDPFEMAVRAVLGQQITVKAAGTLAARIAAALGTEIATDIPGLVHTFPTATDLLDLPGNLADHLGPLGVTASRSAAIERLAKAVCEESIDFSCSADPESEMEKLLSIKGIGPWTAQYIAMRTMGYTDAFPETDFGIKKALGGTPKERLAAAEVWRPWRSYATISLWNSLE